MFESFKNVLYSHEKIRMLNVTLAQQKLPPHYQRAGFQKEGMWGMGGRGRGEHSQ